MYRRGIVKEVDVDTHRVKVEFPEKQGVISPWLDVTVRDALDDSEFSLPSKGAQVACIMDEKDESGCCLGAIYSKQDKPKGPKSEDVRHWTMKDGAKLKYDREAHELVVEIPAGGTVNVSVGGGAELELTASGAKLTKGGTELSLDDALAALKGAITELGTGGTGVATSATLTPTLTLFVAYLVAAQAFYNGPIGALSGGTAAPAAAAAAALATALALPTNFSITVKAGA